MKTEADIREDLFRYIKETALMKKVNGNLFKYEDERPLNRLAEDVVIAPLTDVPFSDIQEVIVLVRIYVKDLKEQNLRKADGIRIKEIETLCKKCFEVFQTKEARCVLESIKTFRNDATDEHCIVNRINYKFCNY